MTSDLTDKAIFSIRYGHYGGLTLGTVTTRENMTKTTLYIR